MFLLKVTTTRLPWLPPLTVTGQIYDRFFIVVVWFIILVNCVFNLYGVFGSNPISVHTSP